MKKAGVAVLAVLAVVAAGVPFANGILMEKGFRRLVAEVNTLYAEQGADLQVEIVRYERGYSTSEVEWKVDLGSMKTLYNIDEIIMLDRGRHGWRGVVFTTSLERNSWYKDFVSSQPGGKDPLAIATEYTLGGSIRSNVALQPLTVTIDGKPFESRAAQFTLESDWELERFQASGTWEGLVVPGTMSVEGVSFNSDLRLISSFIWDGGVSAHIGRLSSQDGATEITMDGLRSGYSLKYDEVRKTLDIEASYGVGLLSDGLEKIENGSATFGVRGLDAPAYEEAMKTYTALLGDLLADLGAAGDDPKEVMAALEARMASVGLQMIGLVEKFFKSGLEIFVSDFRAGLAQGEIRGEALLRLEKDLSLGQMIPMTQQPEQIFEYLSFRSDVRLPAELVGDNPMLLEPVYPGMNTGLFVKEGTEAVSRTETRDKKFFINSQQLLFN